MANNIHIVIPLIFRALDTVIARIKDTLSEAAKVCNLEKQKLLHRILLASLMVLA